MADSKITALAALTAADPANDMVPIVDVSDNSMAASGTTKRISINNILACSPSATLASATISGDLTVDTSTLKVDSTNNRVGILTATPADTLDVNGRVTALRYLSSSSNASLPSFAVSAGNGAYNSGTNEIGFSINSTSAMTLNSTGLGIGRSPIAKLNVDKASQTPGGTTPNGAFVITDNVASNLALELGVNSASLPYIQSRNSTSATYYDLLINPNGGNVGIGVTPAGTGGCLQLKSGITFPATQVASSDANTLDDYEEGTWTGTLKGSVSDPTTPVTATGIYTKVGKLVTITIAYANVNTTGASGNVTITGLPFTGAATGAGSVITFDMFTTSTTLACWNVGTTIAFYVSGGFIPATHNAGASRNVNVTMTYFV